ncbi:hypothetical protein IWW57_000631 [Coemansia sp. S610]|nr:hypothetical protein IWW57_000631 [Coemansia sp. S610]
MESHTHYSPKILVLGAMAAMGLWLVLSGIKHPSYWQPTSGGAYMDALNSTLGFHRVYATYDSKSDSSGQTHRTAGHRENLEAISRLVGFSVHFVKATTSEQAAALQRQHGFKADATSIAELDTHRRIYADMVANNIQSALVLSSQVDVEIDLKMRLASAMGHKKARHYDILFLGQLYSDKSEPGASDVSAVLKQSPTSADSSLVQQRMWTKETFLSRKTQSFRSMFPNGVSHAYAVSGHMARRLDRRLKHRMKRHDHDLDYILADVAMVGLSLGYGVSPPPIAMHCSEKMGGQHLSQSALYAMSLRAEDPSNYAPYIDWIDMWK